MKSKKKLEKKEKTNKDNARKDSKMKEKAKAQEIKPSDEKLETKVIKEKGKQSKSELILKMVEQGLTRKEIIDKMVTLDPDISRKSNAGLVSNVLTKNNLNHIPSGVDRKVKKKIRVEEIPGDGLAV